MFDDDDALPRRRPEGEVDQKAENAPAVREETVPDEPAPAAAPTRSRGKLWRRLALAFLALILIYYPLGMIVRHQINDDVAFSFDKEAHLPGASESVAMAAALIEREVDDAGWVPNDPFFYPTAPLDNMPNFQEGLRASVFRFAIELTDQIGRTRGSGQSDPDLDIASGELKFPGNVWVWNPSISWLPQSTSEQRYRRAVEHLRKYNERLVAGDSVFDRRADNLLATLDRFAADLGSASAEIAQHVNEQTGLIDLTADDLFYNVKGRLYGYHMLLIALEADFADVIAEKQLDAVWPQMLESMRLAATLQPWVVVNGAPDSQVLPSHLVAQGFYLLRGRTQLREITNILLK